MSNQGLISAKYAYCSDRSKQWSVTSGVGVSQIQTILSAVERVPFYPDSVYHGEHESANNSLS